ncbi:MAG: DUF2721 domain-containing protein [Vampirovibrionales bacterium]|nr:DUF2721 domain-containing protein [Vampirovibrionales bacterium]
MTQSPFELLTLIVAPAILTNSASVLSLGTSNRFARTVDRSRFIYEKMKEPEKLPASEVALYQKQLPIVGKRSLLLVKALTCFYIAIGAFAATAFVSLMGAAVTLFHYVLVSNITMMAALACGVVGVISLVLGTVLLVQEMWLALNFLHAEVELSEGIQVNPIL